MPRGIPSKGYRKSRKIISESKNFRFEQSPALNRIVTDEYDEQIGQKIAKRFSILSKLTQSCIDGTIRSMIVSGPAGLGKSYTVEKSVEQLSDDCYKIVKGFTRPTNLYKTLYQHRNRNQVVVFDDCDSAFLDVDCLNLLKAACDTTERRILTWGAETLMTTDEGDRVPTSFEFQGSVIFITNYDFDRTIDSNSKLGVHFEALISRSHYLDLEMKSERDYLVRIRQMIREGLLDSKNITSKQKKEVEQFIEDHYLDLRELSLRIALKIADLVSIGNDDWQDIARITLFKRR